MIRAIAIDDEPIALDVIRNLAEKVPFLDLKQSFTDPFAAIDFLQKESIDLVFIDIKMPDISGIDWVRGLHHKPLIIFTTAYSEHAVTGFELDAIDYLLKPFSLARFLKACTKVQNWLQHLHEHEKEAEQYLFFKSGNEQIRVKLQEIIFLEATGNYVQIVREKDHFLTRLTLTEAEELLPKDLFIRIHRSFIVHKHQINRLERHQLTTSNGAILPIGSAYKNHLQWPQSIQG
jgi:two-component system LytT family response regulator